MEKNPISEDVAYALQYRLYLSRYAYFDLVGPVIETTHSEIIEENIFPVYQSYLGELRKQMGINDLNSLELSEPVFQALLNSSIYALSSSKEFLLIEEDARELEKILSELGTLLAVTNAQGFKLLHAKKMLSILNVHEKLIHSFVENPRLEGFGALLEKVRGYLGEKS